MEDLPEYNDNVVLDRDYEQRLREVYRPLVATVTANQVNNPATYDYDQEAYFYEINDRNLKLSQERLIAQKNRQETGMA